MKFTLADLMAGRYNRKLQREKIRKFAPPVKTLSFESVPLPNSENPVTYPAPKGTPTPLMFDIEPTPKKKLRYEFKLEDIITDYCIYRNGVCVKTIDTPPRNKKGYIDGKQIIMDYLETHNVNSKDVVCVWAIRKNNRTLVYTYVA